MNLRAVAGVLAAFSAVALASPPQSLRSDQAPVNAERVESGETRSPEGQLVSWRIRLLPLSSFPDLPAAVVAQLNQRQCMIPQSFEAKQPENVVHGALQSPGSTDWAVLCSSQEKTTLYVFFAGQFGSPIALRTQSDSAWLDAEPGSSELGSSWGITVRSAAELRATPELHRGLSIDHDAIDDARLERSLTIHYFQAGRWIHLNRGDSSD